ncbi:MAG: DUF6174 domain-containing protein [Armatimonadota bacterium]
MAGCGGAVFTDDIATGNALWTSTRISSYSFTVQPYGFMLPQKYTVVVTADGTSTVTPLGDSLPPGPQPVFRSMNSLYARLRDVRQNGGVATVKFDVTDGHITECYVDPYQELADDEIGYTISDFKVE